MLGHCQVTALRRSEEQGADIREKDLQQRLIGHIPLVRQGLEFDDASEEVEAEVEVEE